MAIAPHRATADRERLASTVSSCAFEVLGTKVSAAVPLVEAGVDLLAGTLGKELNVGLPESTLSDRLYLEH